MEMSNPEVIQQPGPRRSLRAYWTPLFFIAIAVAVPTTSVYRATHVDPDAAELAGESAIPPWLTVPLMSALCIAIAVVSEQSVRKQLALARIGQVADGIIDSVRQYRPSRKRAATWSFAAADGHTYQGRCMLNDIDAMVLRSGSEVRVCYDPSNPANNRIENAFWAVEWE